MPFYTVASSFLDVPLLEQEFPTLWNYGTSIFCPSSQHILHTFLQTLSQDIILFGQVTLYFDIIRTVYLLTEVLSKH